MEEAKKQPTPTFVATVTDSYVTASFIWLNVLENNVKTVK